MKRGKFKKSLPDFSQYKKFPSWPQWKQLPRTLTKFEKFALILFMVLLIGSGASLISYYNYTNTVIKPASGGSFTEGMVGQPNFINPVYVGSNDVDRSLVQLTFSGLMEYKNGEIVPDLAESYDTEEGKVWTVTLKDGLTWQDGEPITAEDVVFTVNVLQDSDYKSPQRVNWMGVDASKVSSKKVKFELDSAYPQFIENLTVKIIPKHVWKNVQASDFSLSSYNLKPIGSGPYQIRDLNRENNHITSLTLVKNPHYHKKTYINEINFKFFENNTALKEAAQEGEIDTYPADVPAANYQEYAFSLPRYFAVFFNPDQQEILEDKKVRQALNYATDRKQIIKQVLEGKGQVASSPILPSIFGFEQPSRNYSYDPEKAKELLAETDFEDSNEDGIREKSKPKEFEFSQRLENGMENESVEELQKCLAEEVDYNQENVTGYYGGETEEAVTKFQEKYQEDVLSPHGLESGTGIVSESTREKLNQVCFEQPTDPLSIELTLVDQPEMNEVAELLRQQWKEAGIDLKVKTVSLSDLKAEHLKNRDYESLLFGQSLGVKPDFYSFWHSSQSQEPGLNLAQFESEEADDLLAEARKTLNEEERVQDHQEFQDIVLESAPAIFLYNPKFTYYNSKVKGISPSLIVNPAHRFSSVEQWYLRTEK